MAESERPPASAGLCASCVNARVVRSGKGSTFIMCELSKSDPRFRKYPPLPVLRCEGWQPTPTGRDSDG
jgi:hypothetical protein